MSDVTQMLQAIESGDPTAAEQLLPLVYDELRKLARHKLHQEKPGQTLQATALVHEAYLRLVGKRESGVRGQESERGILGANADSHPPIPDSRSPSPAFSSRSHFFSAAAEAMRRILIDQARRKHALKAGGQRERLHAEQLAEIAAEPSTDALDLLALDEALQKLERENPRKAQLVKLRYFAGLTIDEAAKVLGIAPSTANADWLYAKSWLRLEMRPAEPS